jgi:hypothetical protein
MRKSELYVMAQMAVMRDNQTPDKDKLAILRELQEREDMARYLEKEGDAE